MIVNSCLLVLYVLLVVCFVRIHFYMLGKRWRGEGGAQEVSPRH